MNLSQSYCIYAPIKILFLRFVKKRSQNGEVNGQKEREPMRAVVQRVKEAEVRVEEKVIGKIGHGVAVFLGVEQTDEIQDADYLVSKIVQLRIFKDSEQKFNRSLLDVQGAMLVVSQFTLLGDCRKGRRPSFSDAAPPEKARGLYEYFISRVAQSGIPVASGEFQAMMEVFLINDGPVTMLLDSKRRF